MILFLVHHGDAVGPDVDARRPLSTRGAADVERLAARSATRGAHPATIWHSGKLRAKQTAEAFWRACNPLPVFAATKDLQPDDPPEWIRDRLRGETRDIMIVGHYPHLPRLLPLLTAEAAAFPQHGVVALASNDQGATWQELWRMTVG